MNAVAQEIGRYQNPVSDDSTPPAGLAAATLAHNRGRYSHRLKALLVRHTDLDRRIQMELLRPSPDDLHLQQMKRQRLQLKDEMARLDRAERIITLSA